MSRGRGGGTCYEGERNRYELPSLSKTAKYTNVAFLLSASVHRTLARAYITQPRTLTHSPALTHQYHQPPVQINRQYPPPSSRVPPQLADLTTTNPHTHTHMYTGSPSPPPAARSDRYLRSDVRLLVVQHRLHFTQGAPRCHRCDDGRSGHR